jgi:hypothetical protein
MGDTGESAKPSQPGAYVGYRVAWLAVIGGVLAFRWHSLAASILLVLLGAALCGEGAYLLLDVDEYSGRVDAYLRADERPRARAMFPGRSWKLHGSVIAMIGIVFIIKAA